MLTKTLAEERVDPRAKRTRQLLLEAFGQLVTEKSFEDITVQDITERATVNRATFYAHFQDKYILAEQFVQEWVQRALHKNFPPGAAFTSENLQLLIQTLCEFLAQMHTHCAPSNRQQFDSVLEQEVKQQVYEILLDWLKQNALPRSANQTQIELQATMASWAMYGAARRWSQGERKESAEQFARNALPMFMVSLDVSSSAATKTKMAARK
jgi:AcrR family transcriptional regulator